MQPRNLQAHAAMLRELALLRALGVSLRTVRRRPVKRPSSLSAPPPARPELLPAANPPQLAGLPADVTIDESVFAAARSKVLRTYTLVGATENLNDFVARLSQLMGWQPPARYENRNVGNYDTAVIPHEIVGAIRERNKWDQRLYEELAVSGASGTASSGCPVSAA